MTNPGHNLLIFNPETDYAHSAGSKFYTPSAKILKIRQHFCLLPSLWAKKNDFLLLPDDVSDDSVNNLPYFKEACCKFLNLIRESQIHLHANEISKIKPWGWNIPLREKLFNLGLNKNILPSPERLINLKKLAHRKTCIPFRKRLKELLPNIIIDEGEELFTLAEALSFLNDNPGAYFKTPWSSSGKGVAASFNLSEQRLTEWINGALRRQKSLMAERNFGKTADFASEWWLKNGKVHFLGLSFFTTTQAGNYLNNYEGTQSEIENLICENCIEWSDDIIKAQQVTLEEQIAPSYDGPLGIDMISDGNKRLNPCIEINLRFTMGIVALLNSTLI